jgi:hypothetical protein
MDTFQLILVCALYPLHLPACHSLVTPLLLSKLLLVEVAAKAFYLYSSRPGNLNVRVQRPQTSQLVE